MLIQLYFGTFLQFPKTSSLFLGRRTKRHSSSFTPPTNYSTVLSFSFYYKGTRIATGCPSQCIENFRVSRILLWNTIFSLKKLRKFFFFFESQMLGQGRSTLSPGTSTIKDWIRNENRMALVRLELLESVLKAAAANWHKRLILFLLNRRNVTSLENKHSSF